ncbi:hypothetical protein AGMMS4952_21020 [Spirochaetia bacterium]|nr:hypothetical protein AGMMS4952_21020 [Spirochaetia bacterium]
MPEQKDIPRWPSLGFPGDGLFYEKAGGVTVMVVRERWTKRSEGDMMGRMHPVSLRTETEKPPGAGLR